MHIDFDRIVSRHHTASVKWDGRGGYFGTDDLIPLWVADMDFPAPPAVTEALLQRAAHPIYGYTLATDEVFESLRAWLQRRHGWEVPLEWIMLSPGVVPSLHAAILALTPPQAGIVIQPPVYHPFFSAASATERRLILNPLRLENGRYTIDTAHLEQCAAEGARLLLLCSPHNPVGRVWSSAELSEVLRIAERYGLIVVSDEIHHDLIYPGRRFVPTATLAADSDRVITAVAPSKTFNIPGLGLSALVVPNPQHRAAIRKAFALLHLGAANPFSLTAFAAAYRDGDAWLDDLLAYLAANRDYVAEFMRRHLPAIKPIQPEGTYLLWLDCRDMQSTDEALQAFFVQQAKVGLISGVTFGENGSGFTRMNIGAPRAVLAAALERIAAAAG